MTLKLSKDKQLWVAEQRGSAVFLRWGTAGGVGRISTKTFGSAEEAKVFLDVERNERLRDGYALISEDSRIDDPFTLDGAHKAPRPLPSRFSEDADLIRTCVLGGFEDDEAIDWRIDDLVNHVVRPPTGLKAQLVRVADEARAEKRRLRRPSVCVNDALDRAFIELNGLGIIALQNSGARFGSSAHDAWAEAQLVAKKRPESDGACVYGLAELVRGVRGDGLRLTCRSWPGRNVDVAALVFDVLGRHGVAATRDGELVVVAPFVWFRA
jgi:hypothetical protein